MKFKRIKCAVLAATLAVSSLFVATADVEAAMKGTWKQDSKGYWFSTSQGQGNGYAKNEWVDGYWLDSKGYWTYKAKATWRKNANGWWYGDTSGWYAKNQWQTIDGVKYYFDGKGYMVANAFAKGNKFDKNGKKVDSGYKWLTVGGKKKYGKSSKLYVKGVQTIDGVKYYFNTNGVLITSAYSNGYKMNKNGKIVDSGYKWIKGTGSHSSTFRYGKSNANYIKGWANIDGADYYFDADGWMLRWTVRKIGGKIYAFKATGQLGVYTEVTAGTGEISSEVTFNVNDSNRKKAAEDMETFLVLATKEGSKKTVTVDGVKKTVVNSGGFIWVDDETLVDYVSKTTTTKTVVEGTGTAAKLFDALRMSNLGAGETYNYSFRIGNSKYTKLNVAQSTMSFTVDKKSYSAYYDETEKKVYILGNVSSTNFLKSLQSAGAVSKVTTKKSTR